MTADLATKKFKQAPILPANFREEILADSKKSNTMFDSILPPYYKSRSTIHWTPIETTKRIAEYLSDLNDDNTKFLDVGSGCGKLCIILTYLTKFHIHGIEQRKDLFTVAQKIKYANKLERVHFENINMMDFKNWDDFDVLYFFNPFQEHITDIDLMHIDDNLDFDKKYYSQYTSEVFRRLSWAKKGMKMISYHGFGGRMPDSWKLIKGDAMNDGSLCLWEKF